MLREDQWVRNSDTAQQSQLVSASPCLGPLLGRLEIWMVTGWERTGVNWRLIRSCLVPGQGWLEEWSSSMWSVHVAGFPYNMAATCSWTSYSVAQGSKYECSREQAGSCSLFYDPALEVTYHPFCYPVLVEPVTASLIFKGKGIEPGAICHSFC